MRPYLAVPVLVAVALAACAAAFGMAGTLDRPAIALPTGSGLDALNTALADAAFRFVGGRYINAGTDLYYGGDEADASRFLAALAACEGVTLDLRFRTRPQAAGLLIRQADSVDPFPADARWHVQHNGWADAGRVTVTVFTGEGGLDVTAMELPEWRGRLRPAAEAAAAE